MSGEDEEEAKGGNGLLGDFVAEGGCCLLEAVGAFSALAFLLLVPPFFLMS